MSTPRFKNYNGQHRSQTTMAWTSREIYQILKHPKRRERGLERREYIGQRMS